jgi:hypothetical protein
VSEPVTVEQITAKPYRPGDTVILRLPAGMHPEGVQRVYEVAEEFTERSGVHILVLTHEVEVISSESQGATG